MIEPQDAAGVEGRFEGLRIALPGDVLEDFVDRVAPLQHRVVLAPRADQVRQRKLLAGKVKLQRMRKRHLERVILAAGAALEQELALFGVDEQLGGFSRAAGVFGDRFNDADVEMRHHDDQFLSPEALASTASLLPGHAGAGNGALNGGRDRLHYWLAVELEVFIAAVELTLNTRSVGILP